MIGAINRVLAVFSALTLFSVWGNVFQIEVADFAKRVIAGFREVFHPILDVILSPFNIELYAIEKDALWFISLSVSTIVLSPFFISIVRRERSQDFGVAVFFMLVIAQMLWFLGEVSKGEPSQLLFAVVAICFFYYFIPTTGSVIYHLELLPRIPEKPRRPRSSNVKVGQSLENLMGDYEDKMKKFKEAQEEARTIWVDLVRELRTTLSRPFEILIYCFGFVFMNEYLKSL